MKKSHLLLLFILLGTTLAQANNTKPKAVISNSLGTYVIEPGQTITFDGRASYDLDGGGIAAYHWYENGSGSHSSTSATFVKTYSSTGTFTLKLRVTDHENTSDEKTVTIQVRSSVAGTKYYITDHLGSVRSTVNHLGQVVGQEDFWSYGLTMPGRSWNNGNAYDRYKFTGVERDSEGGLELDAFGSRIYDPELGLFLGVDRFFAKYSNLTPYHYAAGNPIRFIDVNGDSLIRVNIVDPSGTVTTQDGSTSVVIDHRYLTNLMSILSVAIAHNIPIQINSAFRTSEYQLSEDIQSNGTTPAGADSPHTAGLALDFNLFIQNNRTQGVLIDNLGQNRNNNALLQGMVDAGGRWGGDFTTPDRIHTDVAHSSQIESIYGQSFINIRNSNQNQASSGRALETIKLIYILNEN